MRHIIERIKAAKWNAAERLRCWLNRNGLHALARALFAPVKAGNWTGAWQVGAGWQISSTNPLYTFNDPLYIRFTSTSVFWKFLPTLAGLSTLFGKRNKRPTIEIAIAHDSTVKNLCVDPPVNSTVVVTDAAGITQTVTARLVDDNIGEVGPEKEVARVIMFVATTDIS